MENQQELIDLLESILNKCQISLFLLGGAQIQPELYNWLPTVLEHLYEDVQKIIDNWCVKHESLN